MKTIKKIPMELVTVEIIPNQLEYGKFYYSEKYKTATHMCACGCEQHFSVPINEGEWKITGIEKLTVVPSFHHRIQCMAHYVITEGNAHILQDGKPKETWFTQTGHDAQPGE